MSRPKQENWKKWGLVLTFWRKWARLTQGEFADQLGCSRSTVAGWESGVAKPPNKVMCEEIAEVLRKDPRIVWEKAGLSRIPDEEWKLIEAIVDPDLLSSVRFP